VMTEAMLTPVISNMPRRISCTGLFRPREIVYNSPKNDHAKADSTMIPIVVRYRAEMLVTFAPRTLAFRRALRSFQVIEMATTAFKATLMASKRIDIIRTLSMETPGTHFREEMKPTTDRNINVRRDYTSSAVTYLVDLCTA
jgi:hypothetical protein